MAVAGDDEHGRAVLRHGEQHPVLVAATQLGQMGLRSAGTDREIRGGDPRALSVGVVARRREGEVQCPEHLALGGAELELLAVLVGLGLQLDDVRRDGGDLLDALDAESAGGRDDRAVLRLEGAGDGDVLGELLEDEARLELGEVRRRGLAGGGGVTAALVTRAGAAGGVELGGLLGAAGAQSEGAQSCQAEGPPAEVSGGAEHRVPLHSNVSVPHESRRNANRLHRIEKSFSGHSATRSSKRVSSGVPSLARARSTTSAPPELVAVTATVFSSAM